jgi:hypothetical protein
VTTPGETVLKMDPYPGGPALGSATNTHGRQMHEAVDPLRRAAADEPNGLLPVAEKAIASSVRIVLRADDSSGIHRRRHPRSAVPTRRVGPPDQASRSQARDLAGQVPVRRHAGLLPH